MNGQQLTELGEEVTSEMLSYFPARDVEEPVFGRLDKRVDKLGGKVDALAGSVSRDLREQLRWLVGTQIAVIAIMVALAALVVTLVN